MTFREFLQLSELWYTPGKSGQEDQTKKNTPAKLAGGKDLYNSPPRAGAGAMPGKKMRKMKEDMDGFAGGGRAGADPGFGQGSGGPMGTGMPFCDK